MRMSLPEQMLQLTVRAHPSCWPAAGIRGHRKHPARLIVYCITDRTVQCQPGVRSKYSKLELPSLKWSQNCVRYKL